MRRNRASLSRGEQTTQSQYIEVFAGTVESAPQAQRLIAANWGVWGRAIFLHPFADYSHTGISRPRLNFCLFRPTMALFGVLLSPLALCCASPFLSLLSFLALFLSTSVFWLHLCRRQNGLPPGPTPLPLIGNFAQIDMRNPHRSFVRWKQQYGPIYTVWLPKPCVVVAGAKEMHQLFVGPAHADTFADRPMHSFLYGIFCKHQPDGDGIILARRAVAQKNRRFALTAFRDLGMGGPRMEARIAFHKDELIRHLSPANGGPTVVVDNISTHFALLFGNIIHDLVMGRHYAYNDPEFLFFKKLIDSVIRDVSSVQMLLVDSCPSLRFLFPAYWRYCRDGFALQKFFLREIDEHIARLEMQGGHLVGEPDNFIDAYLLVSRDEGQDWQDPAFKLTLALNAGDLWAGGLETVVTTLSWAVIYLVHHPDVQRILHRELCDHLQGRAFCTGDKKHLKYFRATIDELQRIVNVLPWNLPHSVSEEVTLQEGRWRIPKDTLVMPQIGAVHMDPALFANPEYFFPERFLDDGAAYKPNECLKPFGVGKRKCMGESLASMELAIVLAALVQNFQFEPSGKLLSLRRNVGLASTPDPFECVLRMRNEQPIFG